MDEVSFIVRLLNDNWAASATILTNKGSIIAGHSGIPKFIDVRSIVPKEGRRVDVDLQDVIIVFEDSASTSYPTIDYAVRNETFNFTLHIKVLHRRDYTTATYSRDKLQAMYRIARYILEHNSLRPTVYVGGGTSGTIEESAELLKLTSRSEANDRGKRLLGYKLSVEMKRIGRNT
jgi:hypothetical protein